MPLSPERRKRATILMSLGTLALALSIVFSPTDGNQNLTASSLITESEDVPLPRNPLETEILEEPDEQEIAPLEDEAIAEAPEETGEALDTQISAEEVMEDEETPESESPARAAAPEGRVNAVDGSMAQEHEGSMIEKEAMMADGESHAERHHDEPPLPNTGVPVNGILTLMMSLGFLAFSLDLGRRIRN